MVYIHLLEGLEMKKQNETATTPCYCMRMRRAANRITGYYGDLLAATGLTANQLSLLVTLSRMEGCGLGQLAEAVSLEKSTLVRTLQPLIKAGYIIDSAPKNSRSRQLHLTTNGRDTLARSMPLWQAAQENIRYKLGENHKQIMEMLAVLDQL